MFEGTQAFMRLSLNCFSRIQTISQFLCSKQATIRGNAFVRTEASSLLNHVPGSHRVELGPGTGPRGRAVDGLDIGAAWAQCREVNTHTAAACHNLGHDFQVVEDTLATVFRTGDNIAV